MSALFYCCDVRSRVILNSFQDNEPQLVIPKQVRDDETLFDCKR
jgi:hypothetical protein